MKTQTYKIMLKSPIGIKKGTLTASIDGEAISGTLFIMNAENIFNGTINENGFCQISGTLKTLFHTIIYEGSGTITEHTVSLILNTDKHKLQLNGGADIA